MILTILAILAVAYLCCVAYGIIAEYYFPEPLPENRKPGYGGLIAAILAAIVWVAIVIS